METIGSQSLGSQVRIPGRCLPKIFSSRSAAICHGGSQESDSMPSLSWPS